MRVTLTRLVWLALLLLLGAGSASARVIVPIGVRISGYVGEKPAGINTPFEWVVARKRTQIRLYVQKLTVKTGQVSASDIDNAVNPYTVNFQLAGEKTALATLVSAPSGSRVVVDAYLEIGGGARMMMVNGVEVEAAPTAIAPTPATQ